MLLWKQILAAARIARNTERQSSQDVMWLVSGYSKETHPSVFYPTVNRLFHISSPLAGRGS
jgi:hypothetical protein